MFILDDLFISPLVFIARKVQEAAEQERASQKESLTGQLVQLYSMLEAREIDEAEFDRQEAALLNLLDELGNTTDVDSDDESEENVDSERQLAKVS